MFSPEPVFFADRHEAGRRLAEALLEYAGKDAIVLSLPRGGVVVGYEVARRLQLPLDVIITHKVGAPGNPEYAIGAVAENGEVVLNKPEIRLLGVSEQYLREEIAHQEEEIERRVQLYRNGRRLPSLKNRIAILVDDGIATGFTMFAAAEAVKAEVPAEVVIAVPVAAPSSLQSLKPVVDRIVCLAAPTPFWAVGAFYRDFEQVTDEEVRRYLEESRRGWSDQGREKASGASDESD